MKKAVFGNPKQNSYYLFTFISLNRLISYKKVVSALN